MLHKILTGLRRKILHSTLGRNGRLAEYLTRATLMQFLKYTANGLICFGIEFSILYLLTEHVKLWYIISNSIAFIVANVLNFLINRFWTFHSKADATRQFIMAITLGLFNLLASNAIMYLLTDICRLYYLYSKVITIGIIASWNFILYKKVIYI